MGQGNQMSPKPQWLTSLCVYRAAAYDSRLLGVMVMLTCSHEHSDLPLVSTSDLSYLVCLRAVRQRVWSPWALQARA